MVAHPSAARPLRPTAGDISGFPLSHVCWPVEAGWSCYLGILDGISLSRQWFSPWGAIIVLPLSHRGHALPSPKYRAVGTLPFRPQARTTWSSPGTRSIAWSLHLTSSDPSASRTTPLMGRDVLRMIFTTSSMSGRGRLNGLIISSSSATSVALMGNVMILKPSSWIGGKVINLKGSGL
jgi:hypothetical protein